MSLPLEEIVNYIEEEIEYIWRFKIKKDFLDRVFLYYESELVASFYYHLRKHLDAFEYDTIRIFSETSTFERGSSKRYDMTIMFEDEYFPWKKHPLMCKQLGTILFAFEFKFVPAIKKIGSINKDISKLMKARKDGKYPQRGFFAFIGDVNFYMLKRVIKDNNLEDNYFLRFLLGFPTNSNKKEWEFSIWNSNEILDGRKRTTRRKPRITYEK